MSQLDRRQALRLLAGIGAAAAVPGLTACGNARGGSPAPEAPTTPVRIGLVAPQAGTYKVIGDDLTQGFKLYLQTHNERLGNHPVELVLADEGETADSARAAVDKLLKQNRVLALTGVTSSVAMEAIKDLVEGARIPLIGSNASPTTLQGAVYIWRTSYVNDEPGKALGKYLAENLDGTVYCIAADYQAGRDEVAGLLATLRPTGRLAADPVYTPFTPTPVKDFTPYLAAIKNSDAAAVFCFYAGTSAIDFVKQYRAAELKPALYAPGFLTEGLILKQQGEAARGIFTSMNYAPDLDNAANRSFAAEYQKAFEQTPTTYAMASYDAAAVLDKAIALAGNELTAQALNSAISKVGQIDSPRGAWQFNQNRTPQQKWYLREVKPDGTLLSNVLVTELTTLG